MRGNWGEVALVLSHLRKAKRIADTGETHEEYGDWAGLTTVEEVRALRDYLLGPEVSCISFDCETTGLSSLDAELLTVQFSGEEGLGFSVPVLHRGEIMEYKEKKLAKARGNKLLKGKEEPQDEAERKWLEENKDKDEPEFIIQVPTPRYIPVPFWSDEEFEEVYDLLDEILASDKPKSGQGVVFDTRMLERSPEDKAITAATAFGFKVENIRDDSLMLSHLLQEKLPANLTTLTALWTPVPYYEENVKEYKSRMWELEDEDLWQYGSADADMVQRIVPQLKEQVVAQGSEWLYENIAIPSIRCATKLEERGVYIDQEYFGRLCSYYREEIDKQTKQLEEQVGRHMDSPTYYQNIQKLLFDEYKLPLTHWVPKETLKKCRKCKKDTPCSGEHAGTSNDALTELYRRTEHPVIPMLTNLRQLHKFSSTYLDGGEGGFKRYIREDSRIHAHWWPGTTSGRYKCDSPNMANPPKGIKIDSDKYGIHTRDAIRDMFGAPPGKLIFNADWSQAEVWVMAYETGDEKLMNLLKGGEDVHAYTARTLCEMGISNKFPKEAVDPELDLYEWKQKHGELRTDGKVFVFGLGYGLTEEGAADRLGCSKEEAGALVSAYTQNVFPGMQQYFARIREELLRSHTVKNIFGRYRHFAEVPVLLALNYHNDLDGALRQAYNHPVQGGAHDLHFLSTIEHENNATLLARVMPTQEMHDSLAMEGDERDPETTAWMIKNTWEGVAKNTILADGSRLGWEIPVEVEFGPSFGSPTHKLTARGDVLELEHDDE